MKPRDTLIGTRSEQLLQRGFFRTYIQAYFLGGEDREVGSAYKVFTDDALQSLRRYLHEDALAAPVLFTDNLSNRVLAIYSSEGETARHIAVSARFRIDPDVMAHLVIEEFVHAQQVLDGVDFAAQRSQFAYDERPYEIEAKRIATEILGYEPDVYETYIRRDEPDGVLYDRAGQ